MTVSPTVAELAGHLERDPAPGAMTADHIWAAVNCIVRISSMSWAAMLRSLVDRLVVLEALRLEGVQRLVGPSRRPAV